MAKPSKKEVSKAARALRGSKSTLTRSLGGEVLRLSQNNKKKK